MKVAKSVGMAPPAANKQTLFGTNCLGWGGEVGVGHGRGGGGGGGQERKGGVLSFSVARGASRWHLC